MSRNQSSKQGHILRSYVQNLAYFIDDHTAQPTCIQISMSFSSNDLGELDEDPWAALRRVATQLLL
jgi:hypothetical protein